MEDREHLIRLLMMVAKQSHQWYQPVAARRLEEFDQAENPDEVSLDDKTVNEAGAHRLRDVNDSLRRAAEWHRSDGTAGDRKDMFDLPRTAIEAVTGLTDELVMLIGSWVRSYMHIPYADPRELGQRWVDDVGRTSWNLLVEHGPLPDFWTSPERL